MEDVVDGAEVGVGDFASEEDFALETLLEVGVAGDVVEDGFEGDVDALEKLVFGFVDFAHAAGGDVADDAEAGEDEFADGEGALLLEEVVGKREDGGVEGVGAFLVAGEEGFEGFL